MQKKLRCKLAFVVARFFNIPTSYLDLKKFVRYNRVLVVSGTLCLQLSVLGLNLSTFPYSH